jgi:hypothetical protein
MEPLERQVNQDAIRQWIETGSDSALCSNLLQPHMVRLDGLGRFALADAQPSGDLQLPAHNHLWPLLQDDPARERARALIHDAFGLYFFVDVTAMTQFRIRMAADAPEGVDELSFGPEAREFSAIAPVLTELGDGVQAFVGLISAVLGLPGNLLLVDEPEAFLHPVLARRLGSNLTELANHHSGNLVVATPGFGRSTSARDRLHSSWFLGRCRPRALVCNMPAKPCDRHEIRFLN